LERHAVIKTLRWGASRRRDHDVGASRRREPRSIRTLPEAPRSLSAPVQDRWNRSSEVGNRVDYLLLSEKIT
jgi:hypothetical protein